MLGCMQGFSGWIGRLLAWPHKRLVLLPMAAGLLLAANDVSGLGNPPNGSTSAPVATPAVANVAADLANDDSVTADSRRHTLAALVSQMRDEDGKIGRQLGCLANAVYFEARGEPLEGQLAVAQTIINRVESGRYASTICGVIAQRGQFGFGRAKARRNGQDWETALAIARIASHDMWDDMAAGAMNFHANWVRPGWDRDDRITRIGNHIFYR
jgi:spore germination cell wall hydrolase CwlJ-like protein